MTSFEAGNSNFYDICNYETLGQSSNPFKIPHQEKSRVNCNVIMCQLNNEFEIHYLIV